MSFPRQGEQRRPVLVVTRNEAIPVLTWIVAAPVTHTIRGIATEVPLGPDEGLSTECAAAFDNLQPIRRSLLTTRAGALDPTRQQEICHALAALSNC